MRAGLRALELLDQEAIESLNALGDYLRCSLAAAIEPLGWEVRGYGSLVRPMPPVTSSGRDLHRALWWAAYQRGLLLMPTGLISLSTPMSAAVCDRVVEELAAAVEEVEVRYARATI
jgi:glutamate-1-semialdehyde 2,1-aminomutase